MTDVYQSLLHQAGFKSLAGADEAGRGACAGPLVAAAVILGTDIPSGLDDSKRLSPARRETLFDAILAAAMAVKIVTIEPADCDRLGVQKANLEALLRAVNGLQPAADFALIDGFAVSGLACPSLGLWKGDQVVQSISAASIVAKVHRDRLMIELAEKYPGYGFETHKGYATASHQRALERLGPCPQHRLSYANVAAVAATSQSSEHPCASSSKVVG